MGTKQSSHAWIGGFAARLMELRPSLSMGAAVQYAVMSIHHAADLDPRRAAEILVAANAAPELALKRRAARPKEAPMARYTSMFGARMFAQTSGTARA